jgi:tRNA(Met) C34 N-acetyltransferase TmcA
MSSKGTTTGLTRGVKPSGDLIPWTLSEQF